MSTNGSASASATPLLLALWRRLNTAFRRRLVEARARAAGKRFVCRALAGASDYNVAVNSDMTVSCNCQDYDGSGRIGDLATSSLAEIFAGEPAMRLRETLGAGRIPIRTCLYCMELTLASPEEARRAISEFRPPRALLVENTSACNVRCLGCRREEVAATRRRPSLSLADFDRIGRQLSENEVDHVCFFNLGEPFASRTVLDELRLLRAHRPGVRFEISTNGVLLDKDAKREAALLADLVYFSLDGPGQGVAERYQVGIDFDRAYRNLRDLVALRDARGLARPVIEWKYVLFRWNDAAQQIDEAVRLAREAGADVISFWPTGNPPWGASWRYRVAPRFRRLGTPSWKGREIVLRSIGGSRA